MDSTSSHTTHSEAEKMQKPSGSGYGASQEEISSMERNEDSRGSGGGRLQAGRQPRGADRYTTSKTCAGAPVTVRY